MRLMIVESPTKAHKISSILGYDWVVRASLGHIVDLPSDSLAVEPGSYRLSYVLSPQGQKVVASLRELARRASEIYLATDPDREGEAIAAHLKVHLGLDRHRRVTFHEITEREIRAALSAPRQIDLRLVGAQEARRALDRLIGYRVSPSLSSIAGLNLSAGRCQSPAVRLVVERQLEIDAFKEAAHFSAAVEFENGEWTAEWKTEPYVGQEDQHMVDRALAERAAACRHFVVVGCSEKSLHQPPPPPFTTSALLQAAGASLGYSPTLTQSLAQKLFEHGHISYHRTDSPNLSDAAIAAIRARSKSAGWPIAEEMRRWPIPDGAQAAHEAIRPTHFEHEEAGENGQQQALYRLIWRRAVASQLADAEYHILELNMESQSEGDKFEFVARSTRPVFQGWKAVIAADKDNDEEEEAQQEHNNQVPTLQHGTEIKASDGTVLNHATKPPRRYTETSLIRKLEQLGIGRPSTYATIIRHICDRGYLTVEKRYLAPTPSGYAVVENLRGKFSFIDYSFTKELEERLDLIAEGKANYLAVVSSLDGKLDEELARLPERKPAYSCPACGRSLKMITANGRSFWGCSGYREGCHVICENDGGKPGSSLERTHGPSDKALAFARKIESAHGLTIPAEAIASAKKLGTWIDDALKKKPLRKGGRGAQRDRRVSRTALRRNRPIGSRVSKPFDKLPDDDG
ncbi:type I DNA topoisomerase [Mesorhizobium sp. GbtcB19]|uniref:type I DNA topoisomerase n=1 Tax=Mesorhizobium sp. GbtcB19 TaxID=2824764 RepID=UPI001C2FAE56|nr:type I DNA topoisomerase [Mesorhizobium sp. GbtcB19]